MRFHLCFFISLTGAIFVPALACEPSDLIEVGFLEDYRTGDPHAIILANRHIAANGFSEERTQEAYTIIAERLGNLPEGGDIARPLLHAFSCLLPSPIGLRAIADYLESIERIKDPHTIYYAYSTLEPYCGLSAANPLASRLRLAIRQYCHRMELQGGPMGDECKRMRLNYFRSDPRWNSPREDELVSRMLHSEPIEVLETPFGSANHQRELERRIALPQVGAGESGFTSDVFRDFVLKMLVQFESIPLFTYRNSHRHDEQGPLRLKSFSTRMDHYHIDWSKGRFDGAGAYAVVDGNGRSWTEELDYPHRIRSGEERWARVKYMVSHQSETGVYWDTDDGLFARHQIALRDKRFAHPEAGETELPALRKAFIKRGRDPLGSLTLRDEYELDVATDLSAQDFEAALRALGAAAKIREFEGAKIRPQVRVRTNRYGADLVWREDLKIGFITLDRFMKDELDAEANVVATHGPFAQWEIELLPQFEELYRTHQSDFDRFFKRMEETFSGEPNPVPKYLQR